MKIQIEIDVSPEEARRFFGLPDVAGMQDQVLKRIQSHVEAAADPANLGNVAAQLVAGGVQSVDALQRAFFEMLSGSGRDSAHEKSTGEDKK